MHDVEVSRRSRRLILSASGFKSLDDACGIACVFEAPNPTKIISPMLGPTSTPCIIFCFLKNVWLAHR
jgi:hypothetical protein